MANNLEKILEKEAFKEDLGGSLFDAHEFIEEKLGKTETSLEGAHSKIDTALEKIDEAGSAIFETSQALEEVHDRMNKTDPTIEKLAELMANLKGEKGDEGYTPQKGKDYFTEKEIEAIKRAITPVKGKDYFTKEEIADFLEKITPVKGRDYFDGEQGKPGRDGESIEGPRGKQGPKGDPGTDAKINKEEFARFVVQFIKELKGNERIDVTNIKNAEPAITPWKRGHSDPKKIDTSDQRWHGAGTGSVVQYADLSSQCDGNTKSFTMPSNSQILGLWSTQYPHNYRPLVDWTGSGTTTLTLTSEVGAPQTGQTLWALYIAS